MSSAANSSIEAESSESATDEATSPQSSVEETKPIREVLRDLERGQIRSKLRKLSVSSSKFAYGEREKKLCILLEIAVRMAIKNKEQKQQRSPSSPKQQADKFGSKDLSLIDEIIAVALKTGQVNLFTDITGNTLAHQLCFDSTAETFHSFVHLMIHLGRKSIFKTPTAASGATAVHFAARNLQLLPSTIDLLAEKCNVDFSTPNKLGSTVLLQACILNSWATVERIVHHYKGSLNVVDVNKNNALHYAAIMGNSEALRYLVSLESIDINAGNKDGQTPLHVICFPKNNFIENLEILLSGGANIQAPDKHNNSVAFYTACHRESLDDLKEVLRLGCCWQTKDDTGRTILHICVQKGKTEFLRYFLSLPEANVNARDNTQSTPAHYLAFAKDCFRKSLDVLINAGADLLALDEHGINIILEALQRGISATDLQYAVDRGCDWRLKTSEGFNAVHLAAEYGDVDTLKYFISLGVDVNERSKAMETPIHRLRFTTVDFQKKLRVFQENEVYRNAVTPDWWNIVLFSVLMERPIEDLQFLVEECACDWDAKTKKWDTVLHIAVKCGNHVAIEYFLSLGAEVNFRNLDEATAISLIGHAEKNFVKILNALLAAGADINSADKYGLTPLLSSVLMGQSKENVEEIVNRGGNLKSESFKKRLPLHLAVVGGNVEVVKYLLSKGADVNLKDIAGNTPVPLCLRSEAGTHLAIIRLLMKHGATLDATNNNAERLLLTAADKLMSKTEMNEILALGVDLSGVNSKGRSLLHSITIAGDADLASFLISKGAAVDLRDHRGRTPLHLSVGSKSPNYFQLVETLLNHGADKNATDNFGINVLFLAAGNGKSKEDLERFVELGVKWKITDVFGQSILHVLAKEGNIEALQYFISLGAEINARTKAKETPLHFVKHCRQNFNETVKLLIDNGVDVEAVDANDLTAFGAAGLAGRSSEDMLYFLEFQKQPESVPEGEPRPIVIHKLGTNLD